MDSPKSSPEASTESVEFQLSQLAMHTPVEPSSQAEEKSTSQASAKSAEESKSSQQAMSGPESSSQPETAGKSTPQPHPSDPASQTPKDESDTRDMAKDCHTNPPADTDSDDDAKSVDSDEEWKRLSSHLCHQNGEPEWSDVVLEVTLLERPLPPINIKTHQEILRRSQTIEILIESTEEGYRSGVSKICLDCGRSFNFPGAISTALARLYGQPLVDVDSLKDLTCFALGYESTTDPNINLPGLRRAMLDYSLDYALAGRLFDRRDVIERGFQLARSITDFDNVENFLRFGLYHYDYGVFCPDLPPNLHWITEEKVDLSGWDQDKVRVFTEIEAFFQKIRVDMLHTSFKIALRPALDRKFKLYRRARSQWTKDRIPDYIRVVPGTTFNFDPRVEDLRIGNAPPLSADRPKELSALVPSILLLTLPFEALACGLRSVEADGRMLRLQLLQDVVEEREARRLHALWVKEQKEKMNKDNIMPEVLLKELMYKESVVEEEIVEEKGQDKKGNGKARAVVAGGSAKGGKPAKMKPVVTREWVGIQAGVATSCSSVVAPSHNKSKKAKRKEAKKLASKR